MKTKKKTRPQEGRDLPYYPYSSFVQKTFGTRVYKVPIKLEGTCPNRDGSLGRGGCIFCGEEGGSFENLKEGSVASQVEVNKARMAKRYKAKKFIAYFQNFTNTYLPLEDFKANIREALVEDIVGLNISTRPDCLPDAYLDFLASLADDYLITLELGLQSVNEDTLRRINRGHDLASFISAVLRSHKRGLRVSAHMILDLPWDRDEDIVSGARILSALGLDEVKIHNLYLVRGTKMNDLYQKGEIALLSKEAYQDRVISFLEHLDPNIVIGRLVGRAPEEAVTHINWNNSWWRIRDEIVEKMVSQGRRQGGLFNKEFSIELRKDEKA